MAKDIKLKLIIDGKEALVTLNTADEKISKLDKKLGGDLVGSLKKVGAAFGLAFGARELFNFAKDSVMAFGEQQEASKKLETALGYVSIELENYASMLQETTTFADDHIITAEAIIATFTKEEDAIKRLTKAAMDFSIVQGIDLPEAAKLITKTVYSSTNALSRYGIEITGAAGSTERLDMAVAKLTRLFGGQAEAQLETTTGKIINLKNAFSDLQEVIGEGLVGAAEGFVDIIEGLDQGISNLFQTMHANALLQGIIDAQTSPAEYIREAVNKGYKEIEGKNKEQLQEMIKFREAQIKAMQNIISPTQEDINTIDQLKAKLDVYKLGLFEIKGKTEEIISASELWLATVSAINDEVWKARGEVLNDPDIFPDIETYLKNKRKEFSEQHPMGMVPIKNKPDYFYDANEMWVEMWKSNNEIAVSAINEIGYAFSDVWRGVIIRRGAGL